jgi:predicted TIM-barrel fold metal-dependent hydrolase
VASRYPEVRIILAHLGGVGNDYRSVAPLAEAHPNLYFDTCGSRHCRGTLEELVASGLGSRLLYGSDMPFIDPGSQLGKVQHAKIPEDVRAAVLRGNALRLFGWEE